MSGSLQLVSGIGSVDRICFRVPEYSTACPEKSAVVCVIIKGGVIYETVFQA
jgi:hypothetical protein